MILRRVFAIAAAVGAVLAGAGVVMVAAAYGLYAWMVLYMPRAAAAAVVAAVIALIVVAIALVAVRTALPGKPKPEKAAPPQSPIDRALALAKEKPMVAAAGALAAGLIALRNPALITLLLGLAGGQASPRPKR